MDSMEANDTSVIFNASTDRQLEGDTALPYPYPVVFMSLYAITAILAVVGNILVVTVLVVRKRLTKGVRYCLVNLAVADFIMAVLSIPSTCINHVYGQWYFPLALCKIIFYVQDSLQVVSVLTITLIGIDRYFAILFPLKFHWLRSDGAIIVGLAIIWLVAIGDCMIDLFYVQEQISYENGVEVSACVYAFPTKRIESGYVIPNVLITYPIPIAILVFTYSSIAWKLYHRTSPGNADAERDLHQRQNMIKVTKMLVVIVVVFILCWSPWQILTMMTWATSSVLAFGGNTERILILSFSWLSMCNCFANPVIYGFSNDNFLKDLKFIWEKLFNTCRSKKKEKVNHQLSTETTTSKLSFQKSN